MKFLVLLFGLLFGLSSFAGFEGLNDGTSLKIFNRINCGTSVNCTRTANGVFDIETTNYGTVENQVSITASPTTITADQCGSTFLNAATPMSVNLPEASTVTGCRYTFITANATTFLVNPDDDDLIITWTATLGEAISNATLGDNITLQAIDGTNWVTVASTGSYTNAN